MEWSGARGWIGGSYAGGKKGDRDWFFVEGLTGPIPTNATRAAVELYLRQGMTGTAWFDDVAVVEEYPPPLDCVMLQPNYRGRLATGAPGQPVRVRARVGNLLPGGLKPDQASFKASVVSMGVTCLQRMGRGLVKRGDLLTAGLVSSSSARFCARCLMASHSGTSSITTRGIPCIAD